MTKQKHILHMGTLSTGLKDFDFEDVEGPDVVDFEDVGVPGFEGPDVEGPGSVRVVFASSAEEDENCDCTDSCSGHCSGGGT